MTTHTKDLFPKPPKAALISIRPCFVEKILSGEKRLEFRRSWAAESVDILVIYSSAPVQKIVATARVIEVIEGSPTALWDLAKEKKGGVTRQLIREYFTGKKKGFAIELSDIAEMDPPIDPKRMFDDFKPPQSFRYLSPEDYNRIFGTGEKSDE